MSFFFDKKSVDPPILRFFLSEGGSESTLLACVPPRPHQPHPQMSDPTAAAVAAALDGMAAAVRRGAFDEASVCEGGAVWPLAYPLCVERGRGLEKKHAAVGAGVGARLDHDGRAVLPFPPLPRSPHLLFTA